MFVERSETSAAETRDSRYLWLPQTAGAAALTAAVVLGIPAAGRGVERLMPSQDNERARIEPQPTRIVGGVPGLVLGHRTGDECRQAKDATANVLKCGGYPQGFQLLIEQCKHDVQSAKSGGYSQSFGEGSTISIPLGCYNDWVGVTPDRFNHAKDGQIIDFPGKPTEHVMDSLE